MPFLRPTTVLRATALGPALSRPPQARTQRRFVHQEYGSGKGNPAGEKPQQQGKNPSEEIEHPGPPSPRVGQGKSTLPNETASNKSHSQSQNAPSKGASKGGAVRGAQPKILNENPPGEHDESVRQHNEEMEHRAEKAHERVANEDAEKDKVPRGYWSGQGR